MPARSANSADYVLPVEVRTDIALRHSDEIVLVGAPTRSHWHDLDQAAEAVKVVGVAGIGPRGVSVGGRRYQQVHRSCSRLPSRVNDGCRHLPVARGCSSTPVTETIHPFVHQTPGHPSGATVELVSRSPNQRPLPSPGVRQFIEL